MVDQVAPTEAISVAVQHPPKKAVQASPRRVGHLAKKKKKTSPRGCGGSGQDGDGGGGDVGVAVPAVGGAGGGGDSTTPRAKTNGRKARLATGRRATVDLFLREVSADGSQIHLMRWRMKKK